MSRSFATAVGLALVSSAQPSDAVVFRGLGDLQGGFSFSRVFGVSDDGSTVVGESSTASGIEAFRWTHAGGIVGLGDLGGAFSSARAASADGSVVVGGSTETPFPSNAEAFRWTEASGMVGIGNLGGSAYAFGASADGSVLVGFSETPFFIHHEAFRWTAGGGMVGLGTFPGRQGF